MDIVQLENLSGEIGAAWLEAASARSFAPQYHPAWISILRASDEEAYGLVARHEGEILGWLLYTVTRRAEGTVVNSLPLLPYGGPFAAYTTIEIGLLDALQGAAKKLGADVLSIATHPLCPTVQCQRWQAAIGAQHVYENFVQVQSLDMHPLDLMPSRPRASFRRKIRHAEDTGLSVRLATTIQELDTWLQLYRIRFAEINATPYPTKFFGRLFHDAVPAGLAELWLVADGEQVIGGTWFLLSSLVVDYFASAFPSDSNDRHPATFVMSRALESFVARRIRWLNWQSSPGRGGVYEFKRRWGATEGAHYYLSNLLKPHGTLVQKRLDAVRSAFPYRFVLPYSLWERDASIE